MRKKLIKLLEWWIVKLQPSTDFPATGLAYDSAVKAIKAQSVRGRRTFYFKLVNSISNKDKETLLNFLNYRHGSKV